MKKLFIGLLISTGSLFSTENTSIKDLADYLEFQSMQSRSYMENADTFEGHQYWKGRYDAYQDIKGALTFYLIGSSKN